MKFRVRHAPHCFKAAGKMRGAERWVWEPWEYRRHLETCRKQAPFSWRAKEAQSCPLPCPVPLTPLLQVSMFPVFPLLPFNFCPLPGEYIPPNKQYASTETLPTAQSPEPTHHRGYCSFGEIISFLLGHFQPTIFKILISALEISLFSTNPITSQYSTLPKQTSQSAPLTPM